MSFTLSFPAREKFSLYGSEFYYDQHEFRNGTYILYIAERAKKGDVEAAHFCAAMRVRIYDIHNNVWFDYQNYLPK